MNSLLHKNNLGSKPAMLHSKPKPLVQAKLTVNEPGDIYEKEADAMADKVLRMMLNETHKQPKHMSGLIGRSVQRKCSHCEEEEKKKPIMRKAQNGTSGMPVSSSFATSLNSTKGGGSSLPQGTRSFMENAFSTDFSSVRVHTNGEASEMSKGINARAFTYGSDIYFNEGQYNASSNEGKHLLAHELAHTIQQGENSISIQRDSVYKDIPENIATSTNANKDTIYSGSVVRREYRNASDRNANTHQMHPPFRVGIRYNESTCQLVVPLTIQFVNQTTSFNTFCGNVYGTTNDSITPVSPEVFNEVKQRIKDELPAEINGWYSVHLGESGCGLCREVPVTVEFEFLEGTGSADKTVIVTGNTGRSYVSPNGRTITLCGESGQDLSTMIHEAGHFALGVGDEYHDPNSVQSPERERPGEYSRMALDAPNRLLEFHDQHFAFAESFLKSIYPDCNPSLRRTRSGPIEFTFPIGINLNSRSTGYDFDFSLGLQLGIPLARMRRLSLMLGPNFSYLFSHKIFLVGFQAGLEGRIPLGFIGSLGLRGFGEGGLQVDFSRLDSSPGFGAYAGGGGGLDLRIFNTGLIGLEVAAGRSGIGSASESDYIRLGLRLGASW